MCITEAAHRIRVEHQGRVVGEIAAVDQMRGLAQHIMGGMDIEIGLRGAGSAGDVKSV